MKKISRFSAACFFATLTAFIALPSFAQSNQDSSRQAGAETALPLKRLSLFSSGVGFFEHSGTVSGSGSSPAYINLPFSIASVNDALKSLTVNDPVSDFPTVRYAASSALAEALRSLKIDLSGNPGIGEILNSLKGAELEIAAPSPISGRIIGVEFRETGITFSGSDTSEAYLSLFTAQGIRVIAIKDISSFAFKDSSINTDLSRALDLLMETRGTEKRSLLLTLPGNGSRQVSLSYVIPTPVWKVSYRLDLSAGTPKLQGWAIIDNDSDTDWNNVALSLVTGRPVSFIQNLYAPYRTSRPVLPLAIAGIAQAQTYESGNYSEAGYGYADYEDAKAANSPMQSRSKSMAMAESADSMYIREAPAPAAAPPLSGGATLQTASGSAAGDQFEYTLKNPVTLERRQSAMLPLVEAQVKAEKALVFSGARASSTSSINPSISAELTNTTGMKLPAGPITVYDGNTYAGDALIEFFPENEKRIISYGDDLSVSGSVSAANSRFVTAVTVADGIMTITRRQNYEKTYTLRNASSEAKRIIIEHPAISGASLAEPTSYDERTPALYRFIRQLPASQELKFTVREETPVSERISLIQLRPETFLSYSTNQEIPANVRSALARAIEFKKIADNAATAVQTLETQRTRLISEQDRIRQNLAAAGSQTPQGQEYLRRMAAMDTDIDALNASIAAADNKAQAAKKDYEAYLGSLKL
ncbi:DUF4139 domain-containing protein [Leadbettera azotonutricia]|uniref:DUF4139 domain-containing protein n=1 Tax=Leadbettera azotonutricia (strain ATCC BAA-888 / DSM 13862 / ZAS-9) TaxID=545695 RepID=F5YA57_LEAAZ|nr:DUF4139 domain-containing protein [Leadbettera azotonutricia]AEF80342.1 conserved hypothetical protein [Leadbettera azotonutricia ZAS-9]